MYRILLVSLFLLLDLYLPAQKVKFGKWEWVIPSENIEGEIIFQNANNNLDVIQYQDQYWFAFRTAPTHFASGKTRLYLLSSYDLTHWKVEKQFHLNADLREPRFSILHDTLHFYFFEAGTHPLKFEPRRMWTCWLDNKTGWSPISQIEGLEGFVPWRIKTRQDTAYLSAYYGVGLYGAGEIQGNLRLFRSTNGTSWTPISEAPQCSIPHAEEGEFMFDETGRLWGTVRLESEGGVVVTAEKNSPGKWRQKKTRMKYDSSFMFGHKGEVYLVSRRNVDGTMGKAPKWLPFGLRKQINLLKYSLTRKRTALWRLDKENLVWIHLKDFPGSGDTAFPAVVHMEGDNFVLFNYSSDFTSQDRSWIGGQLAPTNIYKLNFSISAMD